MLFELRAQTVSPRAAAPFFRSNKFARGAERVDIFTKSSPERARRPGLGLEVSVYPSALSSRPCGGRPERGNLASMATPKLKHGTPGPNGEYGSLSCAH